MLEKPLYHARDELISRLKSVSQVPELPMALVEELREVAWCLIMHHQRFSQQCSLGEDLREEMLYL